MDSYRRLIAVLVGVLIGLSTIIVLLVIWILAYRQQMGKTLAEAAGAEAVADAGSSAGSSDTIEIGYAASPSQEAGNRAMNRSFLEAARDDESVTSSEGLHGPVYWRLNGSQGLSIHCRSAREALRSCITDTDYVPFGYWRPSVCKMTCEEVSTKATVQLIGPSVPLTLCSEDKKTGKQTCYRNGKQVPSMHDLLPEN
jgi:hypothetical protein